MCSNKIMTAFQVSQVPSGGPLLGSFHGSDLPSPVSTTSNTMYATFSSDKSYRRAGFSAIWTQIGLSVIVQNEQFTSVDIREG